MLGSLENDRVPKVITIRVFRAEGLQIIPKSESKPKKYVPKWKVVFIGGKKKMSSDSVLAPNGSPVWNYEVTLKLASKSDPMLILVTDSDDHHVGQVIVPLVAMPPRPPNANERPTDQSRMRVAELEPTRKVTTAYGKIFFWLWVEEYRSVESSGKNSKFGGSLISINSGIRKHHKGHSDKTGSVADSLNYSGSVLSLASSQANVSDKKKPWYKRKIHKSGSRSSVRTEQPAISMSMSNVYETASQPGGTHYRPNRNSALAMPLTTNYDDNDGSILGANSDLTNSDLYNAGMPIRSSTSSVHGGSRSHGSIISSPARPIYTNHNRPDLAAMRSELLNASPVPPIKPPLEPFHPPPKPSLISCSPKSSPTTGGIKVTVECLNVTEDMIRHAAVLVDGYTVPRQDWFYREMGGDSQSQLCIHMPERSTGECWIELETMSYGRIRCPQQFSYVPAPEKPATGGRLNDQTNDSYSSSSPESSDVDNAQSHQLNYNNPSTIVRSAVTPQSRTAQLAQNEGIMMPPRQEQPMPPASTVTDSGLGSPPPIKNRNKGSHTSEETQKPVTTGSVPSSTPKVSSDDENTAYNPFLTSGSNKKMSARSNASHMSTSSNSVKNPLDQSYKLENDGLRAMLNEANETITLMKKQNTEMEQKLASQVVEVDRLSKDLCNLRNRLLQDGLMKYLQK